MLVMKLGLWEQPSTGALQYDHRSFSHHLHQYYRRSMYLLLSPCVIYAYGLLYDNFIV